MNLFSDLCPEPIYYLRGLTQRLNTFEPKYTKMVCGDKWLVMCRLGWVETTGVRRVVKQAEEDAANKMILIIKNLYSQHHNISHVRWTMKLTYVDDIPLPNYLETLNEKLTNIRFTAYPYHGEARTTVIATTSDGFEIIATGKGPTKSLAQENAAKNLLNELE